jgi:hypothetical protein
VQDFVSKSARPMAARFALREMMDEMPGAKAPFSAMLFMGLKPHA